MDTKRRLAVAVIGVLAVAGAGAGTAIAQSGSGSANEKAGTEQQSGPDQDQADFTPANEQGKAEVQDHEASNNAAESEPANDPEPGHADPPSANVAHTPAGETPEPGGSQSQG